MIRVMTFLKYQVVANLVYRSDDSHLEFYLNDIGQPNVATSETERKDVGRHSAQGRQRSKLLLLFFPGEPEDGPLGV